MNRDAVAKVGFACAYTPLPLLHAAGFVPFRLLPLGEAPDRAGGWVHDNMCPHIKRILDRAAAGELPELSGVVFMASCDAMRRLADAWRSVRPDDRVVLVDLPVTSSGRAVAYFSRELERLRELLAEWAGGKMAPAALDRSVELYDRLAEGLAHLAASAARGTLVGGRQFLQWFHNRSVTSPPQETLVELDRLRAKTGVATDTGGRIPLYLFGNVLADPDAFELFTSCGAQIVDDDLCTASRQIVGLGAPSQGDSLARLARGILNRPPCARTLPLEPAAALCERVATRVKSSGARGVVAHVIKFCDPYLARIPALQSRLRDEGLPLLVLEGDCTLRSLGQHRTRIEAFVEMLGGGGP